MIEKTVLDYLADKLQVPVVMEVPEPPAPKRYVVVTKTGSSKTNLISTAMIAVQSCAESLYEAALLNETVKDILPGIVALPSVGACRLDTDYDFTDPESKTYRYQAVFRITFMEG